MGMKKSTMKRMQKVKQREVFKEVAEMKPPDKPIKVLDMKGMPTKILTNKTK